jgi:hypothetical protein
MRTPATPKETHRFLPLLDWKDTIAQVEARNPRTAIQQLESGMRLTFRQIPTLNRHYQQQRQNDHD